MPFTLVADEAETGAVIAPLEYWQAFTIPEIGSPKTAFVQAIDPAALRVL